MERVALSLHQNGEDVSAMKVLDPLPCGLLFDRVDYCRNSPFLRQVPFLFWLIETIRPSSIVELGVKDAVSYFAACQAVDRLGIDTPCQGVGSWDDGAVPSELLEYEAEHYGSFSRLTAENYSSLAATLPERSVDLLIIREPIESSVVDRLEADWLGKLSPQGVVLFSGFGATTVGSTGRRLHEGLTANFPNLNLRIASGATVILYGHQAPEQLKQVAELRFGSRAYSNLHRLFARLGAAQQAEWSVISEAKKVRYMEGKVSAVEAALRHSEDRTVKLGTELDELKEAYDSRNARAAGLEAELFNQGTQQMLLSDERERFAQELDEVRGALATEQAIRVSATEQADALKVELAESSRVAHNLREEIAVRFQELAALARMSEKIEGELRRSEESLRANTRLIETVQSELREKESTIRAKEVLVVAREKELVEARKAAKAAQLQAGDLKDRVDDLQASTSWRITEPLRRLASIMRR